VICELICVSYCNPTYDFPPQDEILLLVATLAEDSYMLEGDCLFVCGSYTIGKIDENGEAINNKF
jgi:hypothetical protein